jgi:hypothetical protein
MFSFRQVHGFASQTLIAFERSGHLPAVPLVSKVRGDLAMGELGGRTLVQRCPIPLQMPPTLDLRARTVARDGVAQELLCDRSQTVRTISPAGSLPRTS